MGSPFCRWRERHRHFNALPAKGNHVCDGGGPPATSGGPDQAAGSRASTMPEGETLAAFAATGATLAIHLSIHALDRVVADLTPHYGPDCPVAVVWRASWPDELVIRATLATVDAQGIDRTALILVGPALAGEGFEDSRLYAADYDRRYRPVGCAPRFPE